MATDPRSRETRQRLEQCWTLELDWDLFPELKKGCFQIGKALCIPPLSVLGGLIILTSFMISPAIIQVPGTQWSERALVWLSINMPTGSTKSALYQYLQNVLLDVRKKCNCSIRDPAWLLGDATCEKMGDLMACNKNRLLGLYDELSTFLSQLNLYRGKGLSMTHELALLLQLYNGSSWTRNTVTGEANFAMESTSLTIGGFSQPSVARALIEQSSSAEIGLAQRFLWLFPQPSYSRFSTLEPVDKKFTDSLVKVLHAVWIPGKSKVLEPRIFRIEENSKVFVKYFDEVQDQLEALASMDDLLSGMLSKSKGQILRVAAALHVLSYVKVSDDEEEEGEEDGVVGGSEKMLEIPDQISEAAIGAAINFVNLCCQQAAYMTGRGTIEEEVQIMKASIMDNSQQANTGANSNAAGFCLKLPGKRLNLSAFLYAKRFRYHGYKRGAMNAFRELEADQMGTLQEIKTKSGTTNYIFTKCDIPHDEEQKMEFGQKLFKYGVSLKEFKDSLEQEELQTPTEKEQKGKRKNDSTNDDSNKIGTPKKKSTKSPKKQLDLTT